MKKQKKNAQSDRGMGWKDLFEAMKIGILVLEKNELRIKRYNHSAQEIFNKDIKLGASITEFVHEFIYDDLIADLKKIFENFKPDKSIVATKSGNWFVIGAEPYKTSIDNSDYAVISFVDVTDLKDELEKKIEIEKQLQLKILNVEEKERWRLGQYLHDSTAQNLLGIKILLDLIDPQLQQLDEQTREELEKIKRLVVKSEKDIRELSHFVLPVEVEEKLADEFQKLITQTKKLYDIECSLQLETDIENIDPAFISSLYYITQEAIRNAISHGQADKVEVILYSDEESIYLKVKDDGIGYKEDEVDDGKGINIMRHRSEIFGGTLEIGEGASGGTIVKCVIPLQQVDERSKPWK